MGYQLDLEIDLPRERVLELFLDEDNLTKWQPELVSFERIEGENREVGAKTRQLHRMGRREVLMIETVTVADFPRSVFRDLRGRRRLESRREPVSCSR